MARVGDAIVTEEDFEFEIRRRMESGRPIGDPASVLKELIERQAMLAKARESEVFDDPEVRREMENQALVRWLDRSLQIEKDQVRVTDEELRSYYESNADAFKKPGMARLAILYRQLPSADSGESREELLAALNEARARFLEDRDAATRQGRISGFGAIAADYSEDAVSRYRGGDLGWVEKTGSGYRWPDRVTEAGLALGVGEVSEVFPAGDGLYVVMKSDERPASATSFDEAATLLRRRLVREKQERIEREFMERLYASVEVKINEERAAKLTVPRQAELRPPTLMPLQDMSLGRRSSERLDNQ